MLHSVRARSIVVSKQSRPSRHYLLNLYKRIGIIVVRSFVEFIEQEG